MSMVQNIRKQLAGSLYSGYLVKTEMAELLGDAKLLISPKHIIAKHMEAKVEDKF